MKVLNSLIVLMSVVSLPALATSGISLIPGELGVATHAMPSVMTRAEVIRDTEAWKRDPVTSDGWRKVGDELGWVFVGPASSGKTRAAVVAETIQAKRNPISADG